MHRPPEMVVARVRRAECSRSRSPQGARPAANPGPASTAPRRPSQGFGNPRRTTPTLRGKGQPPGSPCRSRGGAVAGAHHTGRFTKGSLRLEVRRTEQAAAAARLQHQRRTGGITDGDGPTVARLPGPAADAALSTAHTGTGTGTGNLVGQDLTALGLSDPGGPGREADWLRLARCAVRAPPATCSPPGPSVPREDGPVHVRQEDAWPKLSGWAQRVISDKKLRKAKATAGTRLLPLTLATQTDASGHLGPGRPWHRPARPHRLGPGRCRRAGAHGRPVDRSGPAHRHPPHRAADRPCPPLSCPCGPRAPARPSEPVTVSPDLTRTPAG
ncbi:hypothetical protein SCANM63S_05894 [Streptomyces canarius]